jgi:hypothetical protein
MSCFGLDLLGRENPPPGYYSDSEYWRIQGVGERPTNLTVSLEFFLFLRLNALGTDCF